MFCTSGKLSGRFGEIGDSSAIIQKLPKAEGIECLSTT